MVVAEPPEQDPRRAHELADRSREPPVKVGEILALGGMGRDGQQDLHRELVCALDTLHALPSVIQLACADDRQGDVGRKDLQPQALSLRVLGGPCHGDGADGLAVYA